MATVVTMDTARLDLTPIVPPTLGNEPVGRTVSFVDLVDQAGMRNVVTLPNPPDIRIHGGTADFRVPRPGATVYCISGVSLPVQSKERAREILRRLAYGFGEYASREVVGRYHRDIKAQKSIPRIETDVEAQASRRALSSEALRVKRGLRDLTEATIGELAAATGIAQPNVSRAVAALVVKGAVLSRKEGKRVVCRLAPVNNAAEPLSTASVARRPSDDVEHDGFLRMKP